MKQPVVLDELDPLGGLPSLLSLTRVATGADGAVSLPPRQDLVPFLSVDPVLTLRALRFSQAPILGDKELDRVTPEAILRKLGPGALARMAASPAPRVAGLEPLFRLWVHAVTAAVAARSLAELETVARGVDPDEAYTCALLHDLPLWGHLACRTGTARRSPWGPLEWSRAWRLPEKVQVSWLAAHCGTTDTSAHENLVRAVVGGEAVAILAGYAHPGSTSRVEIDLVHDLAGNDLLRLVDQVQNGLAAVLEASGLDLGRLERPPHPETLRTEPATPVPAFADGIVKLQELGGSERYRPVLTSLVAGACHYLGFDRSFFVQWIGRGRTLLIRTKYDRTAVPVGGRMVVPSPTETALMGRVAGLGKPELLCRQENFRFRLLDHLASDAVLVVPVTGGSATHGLLLLDASYGAACPTRGQGDTKALALAGVCGQTLTALLLKRQDQRSKKEAETDSLTGLLNRRAALAQLRREIQRTKRRGLPMAVLMLDLDHFKLMNDTYGHLAGDRVLARVGQVLRATLRGSDVAARYGGEEFLILQFDTTIEAASIVAARIYKAVEEAGRDIEIPITISIGLTDLRQDDTVETLIQRADEALYASKRRGRNRFSVDSL